MSELLRFVDMVQGEAAVTGNDRADYYVLRAEQARGLASQARTEQARAIHLDLAERYTQLLRYARSERPLLTVIEGGR